MKNKKTLIIVVVLLLLAGVYYAYSTYEKMSAFIPDLSPNEAEIREQIYKVEDEFKKLDTNTDKFLSFAEFNGTSQLFEEMDIDNNEKLSFEEARYMPYFAEIPAGSFVMGSDEPIEGFMEVATDVIPAHKVTLDAFKMSKTEITTAQYTHYLNSALKKGEIAVEVVDAGDEVRVTRPYNVYKVVGAEGTKYAGRQYILLSPIPTLSHKREGPLLIPEHPFNQTWIRYLPKYNEFYVEPEFEDFPAVFVKWHGAMAYAEYYGLSLPTEAEWEYVASGGGQFKFATEDGTNGCDNANYRCYNSENDRNYKGADTPDEYIGFRMPAGTYAPNPYDVYDLAGNVFEWTLDFYREDFYQYCVDNGITKNPVNLDGVDPLKSEVDFSTAGPRTGKATHDQRITRGGAYNFPETMTITQYKNPGYAFVGNDHFGFRVVWRPETTVFNSTN